MPEFGPNDVLIKVRKASICGTDIHIWNWDAWSQKTIKVPMVIGHEFMGEIAKLGAEVTGFQVGERVCGEGHITCGHCRNCRAGKRHLCRNTVGLGVNRTAASPSTSPFRRSTSSGFRRRSPTRSPRSSIRWATRSTPRSPSTWWARTCSSPAQGPSG